MTQINTQLVDETLAAIESDLKHWDQYSFIAWSHLDDNAEVGTIEELRDCGTTACFAGHAILLAGGKYTNGAGWSHPDVRAFGDSSSTAESIAQQLLGFTSTEATKIFYTFTDDFDVLKRTVKDVLNGEYR